MCRRKRAEIPVYSFSKHQRLDQTTSIYSPHVLVLEGIFALYDPRVLELLDMGVCGTRPVPSLRIHVVLTLHARYTVKPMETHVCHDEVSTRSRSRPIIGVSCIMLRRIEPQLFAMYESGVVISKA